MKRSARRAVSPKTLELKWYARRLRDMGYRVNGGQNGGGWMRLAAAMGVKCETRGDARFALRTKLGCPDFRQPEAPGKVTKIKAPAVNVNSDAFLASYEWRRVRMEVLKRDGARCACCGATPADGLRMNVDHIKPRRIFPQFALDPTNLQVLCEVCNHGKGNWDMTDWRRGEAVEEVGRDHLKDILRED